MDRLFSMEVFVAAVELGSLTAAAERMDISAPMAGKHLRFLEERLGARLLQRTTRRQRLTEIGVRYHAACKRILDDVREVEASAEAMRAEPRGLLRISAPVTLGSLRVAAIVPEYLRRHPEVRIEIALSDELVDLIDDGFDAAIRIGKLADSRLVARPLAPYRMVMAASPAYLAAAGRPRSPADLAKHECLGFSIWGRRDGWARVREAPPLESLPLPRFVADNGQALRVAALHGAGIVLQPEALLEGDIARGKLVLLLEDHLPRPAPVHVVYPRERHPMPKLAKFIELLVAKLGPPRK